MMPSPSFRSFKGGSWDLRKQDRRQAQLSISFPDRRVSDRRAGAVGWEGSEPELTWVSKPKSDE